MIMVMNMKRAAIQGPPVQFIGASLCGCPDINKCPNINGIPKMAGRIIFLTIIWFKIPVE